MQEPLSKRLLEEFQCPNEKEPDLRKELNSRLNNICKPCWELKYCPYGPLVEDFPLPPLLLSEYRDRIDYLRSCLETGVMGIDHNIPMDEERKKTFEESITNYDETYCVKKTLSIRSRSIL